jgi:Ring finger domain
MADAAPREDRREGEENNDNNELRQRRPFRPQEEQEGEEEDEIPLIRRLPPLENNNDQGNDQEEEGNHEGEDQRKEEQKQLLLKERRTWFALLALKTGAALVLWWQMGLNSVLFALAARAVVSQSLGRFLSDVIVVEHERTAAELDQADVERRAAALRGQLVGGDDGGAVVDNFTQEQLALVERRRQERVRRIRAVHGLHAAERASGAVARVDGDEDILGAPSDEQGDRTQREWAWSEPRILRWLSKWLGTGSVAGLRPEVFCSSVAIGDRKVTEDRCPVCFCEFALADEVCWMSCCHALHNECYSMWLKEQPVCPVCRLPARGEMFTTMTCGEMRWLRFVPQSARVDVGITARLVRHNVRGITTPARATWTIVLNKGPLRTSPLRRLALAPAATALAALGFVRLCLTLTSIPPMTYVLLTFQIWLFFRGYFISGMFGVTLSILTFAAIALLVNVLTSVQLQRYIGRPLPSSLALEFDPHRLIADAARRMFREFNFLVEADSGNARIPRLFESLIGEQYATLANQFLNPPQVTSELIASVRAYLVELEEKSDASRIALDHANLGEAVDSLNHGLRTHAEGIAFANALDERFRNVHVSEVSELRLVTSEFWQAVAIALCELARILQPWNPPGVSPAYLDMILSSFSRALEFKRVSDLWPTSDRRVVSPDAALNPLDAPESWVMLFRRAQLFMMLFQRDNRFHQLGSNSGAPAWKAEWDAVGDSPSRFDPRVFFIGDALQLLGRIHADAHMALARCEESDPIREDVLKFNDEVTVLCEAVEISARLLPGVAREHWLALPERSLLTQMLPHVKNRFWSIALRGDEPVAAAGDTIEDTTSEGSSEGEIHVDEWQDTRDAHALPATDEDD